MSDKPLVSVVIATYNMARYLPLAVQSALAQSYGNVEVLIVDDGSTDDTRSLVERLRAADPRLKYLYQENQGQAAAKNYGICKSSGQYIAFLDADDMWVPDKLELQLPLFSRLKTTGVVYSRLFYIDENGKQLGVSDNELFRGRVSSPLFVRNFIGFGTTVVRKECFDRLGSFKEGIRMGIDYDLWLRISTQYEFDFVDRPLLYYRVWGGQMSKNCEGRYLSAMEIMKNFLREFPDIVDKPTENEAWADTYVGLGQCLRHLDQRIVPALRLYIRALGYKPAYVPAWKSIVKTVFRMN